MTPEHEPDRSVAAKAPADAGTLFTGRAEYYRRYRPGYPPEVLDLLASEIGWTPAAIVADIGAGTGISTGLLLSGGNTVFAVEPNAAMRAAAEEQFASNPRFRSVDGTAERTTLADASVDLVVSATAFHWFDASASRVEFRRILRPGGHVVLMWNVRRTGEPGIMSAYDALLHRFVRGYAARAARDARTVERIAAFFAPLPFGQHAFANPQRLGLGGLKGRFASASYAPLEADPQFEPAMRELDSMFERFAVDGAVTFSYDTLVYWGRLD